MKARCGIAIVFVLAGGGGSARGEVPLTSGHWESDATHVKVCLDANDDGTIALTFQDLDATPILHPIRVEGSYRVTANKMSDFHVELKVARILRKTISTCRKRVWDAKLDSTRQLGVELKPGATFRLTLGYECSGGRDRVQLCLHGDRVECRELTRVGTTCKESPPVDGSKINLPANP